MKSTRRLVAGWIAAAMACWTLSAFGAADPPPDFDAARQKAKAAWDRLQTAELKPAESEAWRAEALAGIQKALDLAPAAVKPDQVNPLRAALSYLHWAAGDYYEAAVLGEFLARRYPNQSESAAAAQTALAAYAKLMSAARTEPLREAAGRRMADLAQWIVEHWPDSPAADEARMVLIREAAGRHDRKQIVERLASISEQSPRRAEAELLAGQSLWAAYLEAARQPEKTRPPEAEMNQWLDQAQKLLASGIERLRKGKAEVSYGLAAAALARAQIHLAAHRPQEAIVWLEDPKLGPLSLVEANHAVARLGNLRVETLKAALRAMAASGQPDKIPKILAALEKTQNVQLAAVYLALGRQFEESLKELCGQGDGKKADQLSQGFAALLARIADQPVARLGFHHALWLAETYERLAADAEARQSNEAAADYCGKAASIYHAMVTACRADARFAPSPDATVQLQMREARCLRRLGQYEKAMDALVEILKTRENWLDAQREAAQTLQDWGLSDPRRYGSAIRGDREIRREDGSADYLVWGWGGLARRTQSAAELRDAFHEARYHLALCRWLESQSRSGSQRTELLQQARRDILVVAQLDPELGGPARREQYDALLRKIQKALGQKESGLGDPPR